jgi:hypothetical protein
MDADTFLSAACDIGRNDGPALLFDLFFNGVIDISKHPSVVAEIWSNAEFPANNIEPGTWVELFDEAGYTHDGQPAALPAESVVLYRGCHPDRRLGMSWTADPSRAQWFAERNLGKGVGDVYAHRADPGGLLAYIDTACGRGEAEYVINPFWLDHDNVRPLRD